MKTRQNLVFALIAAFGLCGVSSALSADISGKWKSEFESPVGHLKYTFDFKVDGDKLSGKAHRETSEAKIDSDLKNLKLDGDKLSFTETLDFNGTDIAIDYTGKVVGDEIKFTRKVGDYGSSEIVAKREKPEPASAPATNSVTGKWRAEFDTQIGKQKYLFTLKADGNTLTGKANAEIGDGKFETALSDGKINGAEITFVENMDFNGNPVRIDYKGVLNGDQIKLTRKVGDIATEELTANREK